MHLAATLRSLVSPACQDRKSIPRACLALLTGLAVLAPGAARGVTFSENFSAGLDPNLFSVTQTTAGLFSIGATQGVVHLAKAAGSPGGLQNIDVVLDMQAAVGGPVTGDFSVQIDFANAVIGPSVDQVELHTHYADGTIFFDVYDTSSGVNVHVWNGVNVNNPMAVTATGGTFKISRTGSTVTGTFNGATIYSQEISAAMTGVDFVLQLQPGSDDYPSVDFDNLSVTGGPAFFNGETPLSNGVYYLAFPSGSPFGYYSYLTDPNYIYHFDLGYEYVFDANDGHSGVYFYDFKSNDFFYTSPNFTFPYLYDFGLNTVLYYYPDPSNPGRYNTDGVRYFYDFATGTIITK